MPIPSGYTVRAFVATIAVCGLGLTPASAQTPERAPSAPIISKEVLRDPTTIAPAIVSYELRQLDWKSSQVFFQQGWFEHNAGFTVSGLPNDIPVSYAEGRRRNLELALMEVPIALVHNTASYVVEERLIGRYPDHRKLWKTLGWIERFSFTTYRASRVATHYTQWQQNEQLARQLGFK